MSNKFDLHNYIKKHSVPGSASPYSFYRRFHPEESRYYDSFHAYTTNNFSLSFAIQCASQYIHYLRALIKAGALITKKTISRKEFAKENIKYTDTIVITHNTSISDPFKDRFMADITEYLGNKTFMQVILDHKGILNSKSIPQSSIIIQKYNLNNYFSKSWCRMLLRNKNPRTNLFPERNQKLNYNYLQKLRFTNELYTARLNRWIAESLYEVVKRTKANDIYLPAEGHAWERHFIFLCRTKLDYKVYINGLIHPFLSNKSIFSFHDSISPKLKYDHLYIRNEHHMSHVKEADCTLLDNSKKEITTENSGRIYVNEIEYQTHEFDILFLPEGYVTQVIELANLAYKIKNKERELRIAFRLHPDTSNLLRITIKVILGLKNIKLTRETSLNIDIKNSRYYMIKGTSALYYHKIRKENVLVYKPEGSEDISPYWSDPNYRRYSTTESILKQVCGDIDQ